MKRYCKALSLVVALLTAHCSLFLAGCTDDLDIVRQGVIDTDDFYQTDTEALEAVTYCYTLLSNLQMRDMLNCLSGDAIAGGAVRGEMQSLEEIADFSFGVENAQIESAFSGLYDMVYAANLVINKVEPDTDAKQQYIAEARFFRAYAYYDLAVLWGDVPLLTAPIEDGNYSVARDPVEDVWALVISDLEEAIASGYLTQKSSVDDEEGSIRITLQTAQTLLAKVYMTQGDYDSAISLLESVVNSGLYALADCSVGDLHQAPQDYNSEAMLFINLLNDGSADNGGFYFNGIGPNIREGAFDGITSGLWYAGTIDLFYIGYGYIAPSAKLYQAFVDNGEETEGTRRTSTLKTTEEMEEFCGEFSTGKVWPYDNYWNWKQHLDRNSYVADSFAGFYANVTIMRYAEVLLLLAEAKIQKSGAGAGDEYINMTRVRSGLAEGSGFTLDDLKLEKRCEFALEALHYFDLLRWDDARTELADQGETYPLISRYEDVNDGEVTVTYVANSVYGWKEKHITLPIPQEELDVNPNMTQTEAWL